MQESTKINKRPRGRPRAFDPPQALTQILMTFWRHGFAATSLDQLAAAAGMNRPSLYAAFGDKKSMYRRALEAFAAQMREEIATAFAHPKLAESLRRFYRGAIDLYLSGSDGPRGCLYVCTAAVETVQDAEIRQDVIGVLTEIDEVLAARIKQAQREEKAALGADAATLGRLAGSVLHSIAIRARAGQPRRQLEALATSTVALICAGG